MTARLLDVLLLAGCACSRLALCNELQVSPELARADKAWREAQVLELRVGREFDSLDKQEQAYRTAEAAFQAAIKKDPSNPRTLVAYGRFLIFRREFGQARNWYEAALEHEHAPKVFAPSEMAEHHRTLGGLLERAGQVASALGHYQEALDRQPEDERSLITLAVAECASGAPQNAVKVLRDWAAKQREKTPATPKQAGIEALGFYTLAVAQEETGYLEEAHQSYRHAYELAQQAGNADEAGVGERAVLALTRVEELLDVWAQRALENEARKEKKQPLLLDEREELAKAGYRCDEAVHQKNAALNDAAFSHALLRVRAGENVFSDQDKLTLEDEPGYDQFLNAMLGLQDAIAKYPRLARAHFELADCHLLLGRFSKARPLLDAAAAYSPNNMAILQRYGEVLLELGQFQDAHAVFKRLLLLDPLSGRANLGLARALAGLQEDEGQIDSAIDALDRALQLGVQDRRISSTHVLLLKNGRQAEGDIRREGKLYIVAFGRSEYEVPVEDVQELIKRPGLREELLTLRARFERGERPASGPVFKGSTPGASKRATAPNPWGGTIFDR